MRNTGNKFLLNLLSGLSHKQIFFGIWFGIVGIFVALMWAYYRKMNRPNFRRPGDKPGPLIRVDARRLPGEKSASGQGVTVKDGTHSPTRKP